jgi:hypothetical protein
MNKKKNSLKKIFVKKNKKKCIYKYKEIINFPKNIHFLKGYNFKSINVNNAHLMENSRSIFCTTSLFQLI